MFVRQAVEQRLWTLPAGKVKRDESLKSALARELREETGLVAAAASYRQIYYRPKRGTITILYSVIMPRSFVRTRHPNREIAELDFFDMLPLAAAPSARFFGSWNARHQETANLSQAKRLNRPPKSGTPHRNPIHLPMSKKPPT